MAGYGVRKRETAVLAGGPADGVRIKVTDRPSVLQVTRPCGAEVPADDVRVDALYIYRRDLRVDDEPLRYGFDPASP
ncbi:hypothetical protein J7W19_03415 [Streptomyces mobaraensis NBRC 13819 = DSM 40847]|uniref:Uncharacterized protein n=1 Tax=Streptomyces mobaraensis (strain ATCC 29032 / DSM 40847 / JCM 4168 / NBRC 13819 / NCIMB 11159 / IPCR 16-22) TaxID=1223523 RepID=M3BP16_STRM1|nr:hypothetical protein [Streptomyces mobaraensis]EMF01390.1 hypothetical protein H340_06571 [Streptomyces mobaraensis NBRC 13819 = DSM 40847]QTT72616.1 hypothetical protein J7W19_03415 [Streptomyces mobaraensis NBRC 13819 = DSM 40847]